MVAAVKLQRAVACLFLCAACERAPAAPYPIGAPATGAYPLPDAVVARGAGVPGNVGLPPIEIQKVVRASFGAMRACYEAGRLRDRNLQGRVETRFVIDREGRVSSASLVEAATPFSGAIENGTPATWKDPGTTLPDRVVGECVRDIFTKLVFPKPKGGVVSVQYPLIFNPND
jgi:hypothetical protein